MTYDNWPAPKATGRRPSAGLVLALNLCVLAAAIGALFVVDPDKTAATTQVSATGAWSETGGVPASSSTGVRDGMPAAPEGWRAVDRPQDGFFVDLPESFESISLSGSEVENMAQAIRSTNPVLAQVMLSTRETIQGAKLFAVERASGRNLSVMRIELGKKADIDELPRGMLARTYRELGMDDAVEQRVDLPAGDAVRVTSVMSAKELQVRITQHVLVRGTGMWMLTYTDSGNTGSGDPGTGVSDTIASSFRFVD